MKTHTTFTKHRRTVGLALLGLFAGIGCNAALADTHDDDALEISAELRGSKPGPRPGILLVHGAWADATGWQHVIPLLEDDGYTVTAVQIPLTSYADDIAFAKRVIDAQTGPVVVVGHSYGGAVISAAAAGSARVKALVYVAAFGPDAGEVLGDLLHKFGTGPIDSALVPDAAGFFYIDRSKFRAVFAQDVDPVEARVMAAAQKPVNGLTFGAVATAAAWREIPSWYLVARQDRTINPDLERFMAARMNARTRELDSSHVPFISRPRSVVRLIEDAARAP